MKKDQKIIALTFHDVLPESEPQQPGSDPFYRISTQDFQSLLQTLQANGYQSVVSQDIINWLQGIGDLPEKTVLLTFDDGHASDSMYTLPLLQRYGFKGCFFITTSYLGKDGYMTAAQLHYLADAGMEIGAHGISHEPLTQKTIADISKELSISKSFLESELKQTVKSMAVPGGFWNYDVLRIAEDVGYEAIWLSDIGWIGINSSLQQLNRVVVRQPFKLEKVMALVEGDTEAFERLKFRQWAINAAKSILGVERYEKLKNFLRS